MSSPLIPCAHCKGEADVYRKIHPIEHDWSVCCKTCWASTAEYKTEEQARAAWARRDELDTLAAQVQRAVDEASRQADRAIAAERLMRFWKTKAEYLLKEWGPKPAPVQEVEGDWLTEEELKKLYERTWSATDIENRYSLQVCKAIRMALAARAKVADLETALRLAKEVQPDTRELVEAELMEKLAAVEHDRWADWQRHAFNQCHFNADGTATIPAWAVERWTRQIQTAYADLSEAEKESDRREVRRYLPIIAAALRAQQEGK